ncbi:MAG: hypothetical protein HY660_01335 [Armatimonadetes bacterium]|nr:hypothetical protein [Armatimonadota bacterium]
MCGCGQGLGRTERWEHASGPASSLESLRWEQAWRDAERRQAATRTGRSQQPGLAVALLALAVIVGLGAAVLALI